jgi:nucleoside transporter
MTESVAKLNYAVAADLKPPLDMGVRLRLSVMMFLQFAVWGSWFTVFNVYCDKKLGFSGTQIGSLYGTMALGAILSMMVAGQIADRFISSEYIMVGSHLLGAGLLLAMSQLHSYNALWWTALAYALVYNPTLAVANSISFANIPDATRDFPTLRVLGTAGWIAAGISVDFVLPKGSDQTNHPLIMAAVLSGALGLFSFLLPHTPPSRKQGDAVPFLRAFGLLKDPSFGIFFGISFVITIALAFYYTFAGDFLGDIGVKRVATTMTIGQFSELFFMIMLGFALMKFGMKWVLVIGMAAWALRFGLFSVASSGHPFVLIVIGIALHGVCFDFFLAAGFIHTDKKAPESIRGSAQALFSFLTYGVGMYIGNKISGIIVDHYTVNQVKHWSSIWLVPAVGAFACLIVFVLAWHDTPGKLEEKEARGFEPVLAGSPDVGSVP